MTLDPWLLEEEMVRMPSIPFSDFSRGSLPAIVLHPRLLRVAGTYRDKGGSMEGYSRTPENGN